MLWAFPGNIKITAGFHEPRPMSNPGEHPHGAIDIATKIGSAILLLFTSNVCIFSFIAGLLGSVLSGLRSLSIDTRARIRNYELQRNLPPLDFDIITAPEFFKWTKMKSKKNN